MATAPEYLNGRRRSALIVDDSKLACAVLSRLLEQEGYDSELAGSAQEAMQSVRDHRPDVIFMDHLMPGMTGLEAVRALKADARSASIPVVMFSSQEDEAFLQAAREAGASAVLTKHTERTRLGPVLERIGQEACVPDHAATAKKAPPPLRAAERPQAVVGLTRADLRAEIEPMLRAQRDQIHTELLAEFAILEGHQESTRRALTGRLESVLRRTVREVTEQLAARLTPSPAPPRLAFLGLLARGGLAAAALALLAVPVGLVIEQGQRLESMAAATAGIRLAVDTQSRAVSALGRQVESLGQQVTASSATLQRAAEMASAALPAAVPASVAVTQRAAERLPLVELLAASGVEGPVELRTSQGAFCLELEGSGYLLTPMASAGGRCVTGAARAVMASVTPAATPGRFD